MMMMMAMMFWHVFENILLNTFAFSNSEKFFFFRVEFFGRDQQPLARSGKTPVPCCPLEGLYSFRRGGSSQR